MKHMAHITLHLLDTGYCTAREYHVIRGGRQLRIQCHALVALLHHPQQGWLLWDTGYAPRMLTETASWPFSLYRHFTPLFLQPQLAVVAQLQRWRLTPDDIRYVLLSHFHADHIAGLRDFPTAQLLASRAAYTDVAARRGLNALRRGFIPTLLPDDFSKRAILIDTFAGPTLPILGPTHDLFGDESLLLVPLPGHAHGQLGLLVQTERGRVFLAADACWLTRSILENRPPHPLTYFFIDSASALRHTLQQLHEFALACPDVTLIPSHCPVALEQGMKVYS